jgi:hypothetical protein
MTNVQGGADLVPSAEAGTARISVWVILRSPGGFKATHHRQRNCTDEGLPFGVAPHTELRFARACNAKSAKYSDVANALPA